MNSNFICLPTCFLDVLPRLKPRWQSWLILAVVRYMVDRTMPKIPTRMCNDAWIAWILTKGYVDTEDQNRELSAEPDENRLPSSSMQTGLDMLKSFIDQFLNSMDRNAGENSCKNCKPNDELAAKGCKNCNSEGQDVVDMKCADNEQFGENRDEMGCKNCKTENEKRALGCKNCKQTAPFCDFEVSAKEEKKKQKKRVSPCTPFRKENH